MWERCHSEIIWWHANATSRPVTIILAPEAFWLPSTYWESEMYFVGLVNGENTLCSLLMNVLNWELLVIASDPQFLWCVASLCCAHRWFPLRIRSRNAILIFVSFSWDPVFLPVYDNSQWSVRLAGWMTLDPPWLVTITLTKCILFRTAHVQALCLSPPWDVHSSLGNAMASLLRQFHLRLVLGFNYVICSCVNDYCCSCCHAH